MTAAIQPDLTNAAGIPRSRKRPIPSQRNRRVFAEVVLAQRPQPEVAKEFGITQQRVSQIVDQFQAWLAENLPPGAEAMTAEQQLRLAVNTAYMRQEHLYADAMRKLDQSREDKYSLRIRYSAKGEELWRETVRENQFGKSGYLGVALNAVTRQWKLAQMAAGLLGPAMDVVWDFGDSAAREPDRFRCGAGVSPAVPRAERANRAGQAAGTDRAPPRSGGRRWSASADPPEGSVKLTAGQMPAPREASKVLCASAVPACVQKPLAAASAAASPVAVAACSDDAERKVTPQQSAEFCAKSCAAADEPSRGAGVPPAETLAERANRAGQAAGTDRAPPRSGGRRCSASADPPEGSVKLTAGQTPAPPAAQGPCELSEKSCGSRRRQAEPFAVDLRSMGSGVDSGQSFAARDGRRPESTEGPLNRDEPVLLSADDRRRRKHQRQKQLARWRAARQCVAG